MPCKFGVIECPLYNIYYCIPTYKMINTAVAYYNGMYKCKKQIDFCFEEKNGRETIKNRYPCTLLILYRKIKVYVIMAGCKYGCTKGAKKRSFVTVH